MKVPAPTSALWPILVFGAVVGSWMGYNGVPLYLAICLGMLLGAVAAIIDGV